MRKLSLDDYILAMKDAIRRHRRKVSDVGTT